MGNPLKSEAAAFRWLLVALLVAISIGALAALTRPLVGLVWAALLACAAALAYGRSRSRGAAGLTPTRGGDGRRRLLVLGGETAGAAAVLEEIGRRGQGGDCEVLVVAPAPAVAGGEQVAGGGDRAAETDEATVLARQRMELATIEIERTLGFSARGEIGDPDPNVAIADALRVFPADEVVIVTQQAGTSPGLGGSVVDRVRRETGLPVSHVVVDLPSGNAEVS